MITVLDMPALTDRCLTTFINGLHHADPLTLAHEAERLAYEMPSPLVVRMRDAVDAEKAARTDSITGRG